MTFKPALTALTLMAMTASPLMAQTPTPPASQPEGGPHEGHHRTPPHAMMARLSVSGEGSATAAPDIATVTLGVSTRADTAADAMAQNAEQQQKVFDALTALGVAERDIQTSGLNLSPVMDYTPTQEGKPAILTGYTAQNMLTLRVRDLAGLGAALDGLVSAGANEINGIAFSREDMTEAEDAARTAAIQAAQKRAEVMAAAAGMRLGPLISLSDAQSASGPVAFASMARDAKAAATPIAAGELTVSASVTAVFALLPAEGAAEGTDTATE